MANLLCPPVLNQINAASGNPSVSRRHRDLVLAFRQPDKDAKLAQLAIGIR
jgi:hypothetical protein